MIKSRLSGGDAVLLRTPAMCSIVGDGVHERWRPSSKLWEEAILRRNDWQLVHHLRGDGKNQPVSLGGTVKKPPPIPKEYKTRLTAQWNRYAGCALILSDAQYLDIRKRAGLDQASGMGMPDQLCM